MRTKEITFKLRLPINKPNSDGTMYTRETARKMYENLKNCDSFPVGFPIYGNEYLRVDIPKSFDTKLVEEDGELYLVGSGLIPYTKPVLRENHTIYEFYIEEDSDEERL